VLTACVCLMQELTLGLFRSDYMVTVCGRTLDQVEKCTANTQQFRAVYQVEFNTIATSFAPLSAVVGDTHR
jgi:hypothetical protein